MANVITNSFDISTVIANENQINGLKSMNKANSDEVNQIKMVTYGHVIVELMQHLTSKGLVQKAAGRAMRDFLTSEGVKPATVKRLVENSVGAITAFDFPSQATPDAIVSFLADEEITSENKLAKAITGEDKVSKAESLAQAVVGKWSTKKDANGKRIQGDVFKEGLSNEDLEEFRDHMTRLLAEREAYTNHQAAKNAGESVQAETDAVNAMEAFMDS